MSSAAPYFTHSTIRARAMHRPLAVKIALEELLAKRGVNAGDIENMLGRNYLRVLRQSLA